MIFPYSQSGIEFSSKILIQMKNWNRFFARFKYHCVFCNCDWLASSSPLLSFLGHLRSGKGFLQRFAKPFVVCWLHSLLWNKVPLPIFAVGSGDVVLACDHLYQNRTTYFPVFSMAFLLFEWYLYVFVVLHFKFSSQINTIPLKELIRCLR